MNMRPSPRPGSSLASDTTFGPPLRRLASSHTDDTSPRSQAQTRSRPTSSISTSYTWLEDPIDIPPPPPTTKAAASPTPNVMESIRVSLFPQSPAAAPRDPPPGHAPTSPKRWRWLSSRRTSNLGNGGGSGNNSGYTGTRRCCSRSSSNLDLPSTMPPRPRPSPRPVVPHPQRLPHGSDYLCDALYAHIIAYNYLAPMVQSLPHGGTARPRRREAPPAQRTPSQEGGDPAWSAREPRRHPAAAEAAAEAVEHVPRPARVLAAVHLPRVAATAAAAGTHNARRDGAVGVRRPAAGTAAWLAPVHRAAGHDASRGGDREPRRGEPVNEVDPLVMRSLCEIVKCCEESPTNDRSL
ncbi:hypothetical protein Ct61P_14198 [Colletotrichum tofieldiae]|nr:hypothetical protein Ct61P_14198 [Colletotrichum tofieldiae]